MLEVLHYIHHYQASHLGAEGSAGNLISSGVVTLKITPRNLLNSPKKNLKMPWQLSCFSLLMPATKLQRFHFSLIFGCNNLRGFISNRLLQDHWERGEAAAGGTGGEWVGAGRGPGGHKEALQGGVTQEAAPWRFAARGQETIWQEEAEIHCGQVNRWVRPSDWPVKDYENSRLIYEILDGFVTLWQIDHGF